VPEIVGYNIYVVEIEGKYPEDKIHFQKLSTLKIILHFFKQGLQFKHLCAYTTSDNVPQSARPVKVG